MSGPGRAGQTVRVVLCALAMVLAWPSAASAQSGDADAAALVFLGATDSGSAMCGSFQVSWTNTRSFDVGKPGSLTLQATSPDAGVTLDLSRPLATGEKVLPLWCGELLGDGTQALGFESFSGGAHCCFSATVLLLDATGRHLLDTDMGDGGLTVPQQLDAGGPLELPASCNVFAYFDDLSFAASPFLPQVFAYDGTSYVEATRQFPDTLSAERDKAQADLAAAVARPVPADTPPRFAYQEQESIALRLYGLHVLLGDADQALPGILSEVAPPVATWLTTNASAAQAAMSQRYDLGGDASQ